MKRALALARDMRGHVWPNPPVGCVVVKDGAVLAQAATHPGGRPHAERKALEQAGPMARGAELFVTLEPCCHWGKTPPCTDAILDAGVVRVVCAVQDPDPRVDGAGFATLRDAGVAVDVGLCADEARDIMSGFFRRVQSGRPEVAFLGPGTDGVPPGFDAQILGEPGDLRLRTRAGSSHSETNLPVMSADQLLGYLGGLGLTSVAISDPALVTGLAEAAGATVKPQRPRPIDRPATGNPT